VVAQRNGLRDQSSAVIHAGQPNTGRWKHTGDFDGCDGKADLVWRNIGGTSTKHAIWLKDGLTPKT
jgi:hypothetical protein